MNRNLLLISNSTNRGEEYLGWCRDLVKNFCKENNVSDVLFVPYAGVASGYDAYEKKVKDIYATFGVNLHSVHKEKNPKQAVMDAKCIAVGGGNTFNLVYEMYQNDIMQAIRDKAMNGTPYMGWSAGSNVASPSLMTTNDMPIIEPKSFDTLNLVPFQINPHYTDYFDPKHGGETRDDRLNEFIVVNKNIYIAAIREATALVVKGDNLTLVGRNNKMKVFHAGMDTKEYSLTDDINFLMKK